MLESGRGGRRVKDFRLSKWFSMTISVKSAYFCVWPTWLKTLQRRVEYSFRNYFEICWVSCSPNKHSVESKTRSKDPVFERVREYLTLRNVGEDVSLDAFKPSGAYVRKYHCCAAFGIIFWHDAASVTGKITVLINLRAKQAIETCQWPLADGGNLMFWLYRIWVILTAVQTIFGVTLIIYDGIYLRT